MGDLCDNIGFVVGSLPRGSTYVTFHLHIVDVVNVVSVSTDVSKKLDKPKRCKACSIGM